MIQSMQRVSVRAKQVPTATYNYWFVTTCAVLGLLDVGALVWVMGH